MDLDLDYECLHFDIYEDDLLDNLESVYMVNTQSSLHKEQFMSTDHRDPK